MAVEEGRDNEWQSITIIQDFNLRWFIRQNFVGQNLQFSCVTYLILYTVVIEVVGFLNQFFFFFLLDLQIYIFISFIILLIFLYGLLYIHYFC